MIRPASTRDPQAADERAGLTGPASAEDSSLASITTIIQVVIYHPERHDPPLPDSRRCSSRTCAELCTHRRSSPTPRGSTTSPPEAMNTTGTSTEVRWQPSGGAAASFGRGSSIGFVRHTTRIRPSHLCSSRRTSRVRSPVAWQVGVALWPMPLGLVYPRRPSRLRWRTSTGSGGNGCRPRLSKACATTSAHTPIAGSTETACSTPSGPVTGPSRRPESRRWPRGRSVGSVRLQDRPKLVEHARIFDRRRHRLVSPFGDATQGFAQDLAGARLG